VVHLIPLHKVDIHPLLHWFELGDYLSTQLRASHSDGGGGEKFWGNFWGRL
jgi:hypothetical protein